MIKILFLFVLAIMIISCARTDSGPKCLDPVFEEDLTLQECKDRRRPSYSQYGCNDFRWTKNQKNDLGLCELYNCRCPNF
jgi:hypothetical protein